MEEEFEEAFEMVYRAYRCCLFKKLYYTGVVADGVFAVTFCSSECDAKAYILGFAKRRRDSKIYILLAEGRAERTEAYCDDDFEECDYWAADGKYSWSFYVIALERGRRREKKQCEGYRRRERLPSPWELIVEMITESQGVKQSCRASFYNHAYIYARGYESSLSTGEAEERLLEFALETL